MIGGAFSGKKSTAQQIVEEIGDKMIVFNMDDIVREALMFVSNKEEVPDPKAKAVKGKLQETASTNAFEGLDTTVFKELATTILDQIKVSTGAEKVPGKDIDLLSLVKDDTLLVNLFMQKLKLTFHQPQTSSED